MRKSTLRIDIPKGTWMVDLYAERNDNGVYDLVHPSTRAEVKLKDHRVYGFEYNICAPAQTPYKLFLNDAVLIEGTVGHSRYARGNGIFGAPVNIRTHHFMT